jgi:endonuclease/exonuclease/phosphatase family metal-dependent hydrolase
MRTAREVWPTVCTVVTMAVAALAAVVGVGDAGRQLYLQFNLCGNVCNHGGLAVVSDLEAAIAAETPFSVTLNEVCQNQYVRLREDLTAYQSRFDATGPVCGNGYRYGNATLVRASTVDLLGSWALPNPAGGEPRRLMCLGARQSGKPVTVCVTHVSYVQGNIAAQVGAVAALVRGLGDTAPVVLSGDFNTDPWDARLDPLYAANYGSGTGEFQEADAAGYGSGARTSTRRGADPANTYTFDRHKIDYIFLSGGRWSAPHANVMHAPGGLSDHDALWATATLNG